MNKVIARGRLYFEDFQGNLIKAEYVKEDPKRIRVPADVMPLVTEERTESQECLVVITLDGNNQLIKKHRVTMGLANQSQVHPREIFTRAIEDKAVSILLCHNHPSGSVEPSESDLAATRRINEVGRTIGIPLTDHVIVSALSYMSLREKYPNLFGGI